MIKKSLSILLLLIFTFNVAGVFIVFRLQQSSIRKEIKHQIKAGIPESELHTFVLSPQEYHGLDWVRKDLEFRLKQEMFDIVKTEIIGDQFRLHCVNDREEAILFAHLDDLVHTRLNHDSKSDGKPLHRVMDLFKLVYLSFNNTFNPTQVRNSDCVLFAVYINLYSSPYPETIYPPPDLV